MQRRTPASARPASGCSRIFGAAVRMPTTVPRTRSLRTGRHWTNWYRRTTRLGSTYFGRCGQTEQWIRKSGSSWSRTNRDCSPGSGRSELCARRKSLTANGIVQRPVQKMHPAQGAAARTAARRGCVPIGKNGKCYGICTATVVCCAYGRRSALPIEIC